MDPVQNSYQIGLSRISAIWTNFVPPIRASFVPAKKRYSSVPIPFSNICWHRINTLTSFFFFLSFCTHCAVEAWVLVRFGVVTSLSLQLGVVFVVVTKLDTPKSDYQESTGTKWLGLELGLTLNLTQTPIALTPT